jgi:hypothetical protein
MTCQFFDSVNTGYERSANEETPYFGELRDWYDSCGSPTVLPSDARLLRTERCIILLGGREGYGRYSACKSDH